MSFGHTFSANSKRARGGEKVTRRESGFLPKSTNAIFHKSQKLAAEGKREKKDKEEIARFGQIKRGFPTTEQGLARPPFRPERFIPQPRFGNTEMKTTK